MAAELAVAFISLVPSFRGGAGKIGEELGGPAEKAGKDAGERAGKKASTSFGDAFSTGVKAAVGTAAIWGGGALLANGFQLAIDQADLPGRLSAQFGLAAPAAASAAKIAGDLYAQGWGESLAQIGQATGTVSRALQQLGTGEDIGRLTTQAQALSDTLGQDLSQTILSAQKLVQAGLAPSMEAAFDVIAGGFQKIPEAADDGLDTITEYAVQFQALGIDATTAFGLISQATQNGARDTDFVADALKEFNLRVVALNKDAAGAFKSLGLNGKKMQADIAAGGPRASAALDLTLDKLRAFRDPIERAQIAVSLFGTKSEDLQKALLALDPSKAAADMGDLSGAAQNLTDTVGGSVESRLTTLSRTFDQVMAGALTAVLPFLEKFLDFVGPHMDVLGPAAVALGALTAATWLWNAGLGAVLKTGAKVLVFLLRMTFQLVVLTVRVLVAAGAFAIQMVGALIRASVAMTGYVVRLGIAVAATVAGWVIMGTQALIQAARMALAWLIALGPIGIVIAAVVGLAALIILNWQRIVDATVATLTFVGKIFTGAWEGIKTGLGAALRWVTDRWNDLLGFLRGIPGAVGGFFAGIGETILRPFKAAFNGIANAWNNTVGRISFTVPDWVPGIGGKGFSVPKIPTLAQGGIADRPTLAMIGEGGQPEAVMPLSKLDSLLADRGAGSTVVINAAGLDRHLQAWLRQAVRVQGGGSVQGAFGRA